MECRSAGRGAACEHLVLLRWRVEVRSFGWELYNSLGVTWCDCGPGCLNAAERKARSSWIDGAFMAAPWGCCVGAEDLKLFRWKVCPQWKLFYP